MKTRTLGILLFDDVEVLDFAGPFEVFSVAGLRNAGAAPFAVHTIAEKSPVIARNQLAICPSYTLENSPLFDIILLPGGGGIRPDGSPFGSRKEMHNEKILDWVRTQNQQAEMVLSVCTGSMILAKAGLLEGLRATTHWKAEAGMREAAPNTELLMNERYVDNGRIVLSAGISAGIDMAFYVIKKLLGAETALETAQYMQYDYWH